MASRMSWALLTGLFWLCRVRVRASSSSKRSISVVMLIDRCWVKSDFVTAATPVLRGQPAQPHAGYHWDENENNSGLNVLEQRRASREGVPGSRQHCATAAARCTICQDPRCECSPLVGAVLHAILR